MGAKCSHFFAINDWLLRCSRRGKTALDKIFASAVPLKTLHFSANLTRIVALFESRKLFYPQLSDLWVFMCTVTHLQPLLSG